MDLGESLIWMSPYATLGPHVQIPVQLILSLLRPQQKAFKLLCWKRSSNRDSLFYSSACAHAQVIFKPPTCAQPAESEMSITTSKSSSCHTIALIENWFDVSAQYQWIYWHWKSFSLPRRNLKTNNFYNNSVSISKCCSSVSNSTQSPFKTSKKSPARNDIHEFSH
jgi:hypothetical protein